MARGKRKAKFKKYDWNQYFAAEIKKVKENGYHPSTCCNMFKGYAARFTDYYSYVAPIAEDSSPYDSKAGGIPYIAQDDYWPVCPHCGHEQVLLLQLNLQQMPGVPPGLPTQGLIQVFVCYYIPSASWKKSSTIPGVSCWGEGWLYDSSAYTVRLIKPTLPATTYEIPPWVRAYQCDEDTDIRSSNLEVRLIKVDKEAEQYHCAWSTEEEHYYTGCCV